ncbi:hypothetical protein RRG08_003743 [Elysia crispata]|uniref:Uncharacterized protein n=1 Tax=Elysia crispata TaxID=231223 RepID=A0AAE1E5T4_9GAST|nr:hypothetical protein RRG08_003743 [Elysia crispata]
MKLPPSFDTVLLVKSTAQGEGETSICFPTRTYKRNYLETLTPRLSGVVRATRAPSLANFAGRVDLKDAAPNPRPGGIGSTQRNIRANLLAPQPISANNEINKSKTHTGKVTSGKVSGSHLQPESTSIALRTSCP